MSSDRIAKITAKFSRRKIDALLVTDDTNIRYLTNFPAEESWLLITPYKSYYFTDSRYTLEAEKALKGKGIKVVQYKYCMSCRLFEAAVRRDIKVLGYDDQHLTVAKYKKLRRVCPKDIKLKLASGIVECVRQFKEPSEIRNIRKALSIHEKALKFLRKEIKPGFTEQEVFDKLDWFVKEQGVSFAFSPIIAAGPNAALPHAKITHRRIRKNDVVLVDMGINYNGYMSDLTRMFFLGRIPARIREMADILKQAQLKAIDAIEPGIEAKEVDRIARNYLRKHGLSKYFGHSLGHGVGQEVHEAPRLSPTSKAILKERMIITVEPGIYLPDEFGMRMEEMVLVTDKGCEVLSGSID